MLLTVKKNKKNEAPQPQVINRCYSLLQKCLANLGDESNFCSAKKTKQNTLTNKKKEKKCSATGIVQFFSLFSLLKMWHQMSCIFHNEIHIIWERTLLGGRSGNNCTAAQDTKKRLQMAWACDARNCSGEPSKELLIKNRSLEILPL